MATFKPLLHGAPGTLAGYRPRPHRTQRATPPPRSELRAVLVTVAALYGVIAFLIVALIALDFVAALLVTGRAY
ncbi:MAG: hypothetical protein QOH73_614 [Gaiellaceae bacterium]|jgi:hypothetical protein|nr:hypothetical protein [Gaiellaceae bacterium]